MVKITFPTDEVSMALEWHLEKADDKNPFFLISSRGYYGDGWSFIRIDDYSWKFFGKRKDAKKALNVIRKAQKDIQDSLLEDC